MLLFIGSISVFSSNYLAAQDTINIYLAGHQNGLIKWESSNDGTIWSVLSGEVDTFITAVISQPTYYRAQIMEGTCDPFISEIIQVNPGFPFIPCPGLPIITDYDGNFYSTVLIGTQCWMRENLTTTHYADGTSLVDGTNAGDVSGDTITKYWFVHNNDMNFKYIYGLLYSWAAVMKGAASSNSSPSGVQGICPTGWHMPSKSEWEILDSYLGGNFAAGGKMKEAGTIYWLSPNQGATNSSGFTGLPGGNRLDAGTFSNFSVGGYWWSTTVPDYNITLAYDFYLFNTDQNLTSYGNNRPIGFSARCIKD